MVKEPNLSDSLPVSELPLGLPASYWKDLREYDQAATLAGLSLPVLLLQGERDYQVTMVDFDLFQKALPKRKNVTFRSYGNLNHLFMDGEGKATPSEYLEPGVVDNAVITDIANWIRERSD